LVTTAATRTEGDRHIQPHPRLILKRIREETPAINSPNLQSTMASSPHLHHR
jgi:hypothetical protein